MMMLMTAGEAEKATVPMSEVRAWAIRQGLQVNATGNVSSSVVAAYNRAHPTRPYARPDRGETRTT